MRTAKQWHLSPPEWRQLSADDRARMIVHETIESVRDAYAFAQMKKKSGKEEKGENKDTPPNPYMALRSRWTAKRDNVCPS